MIAIMAVASACSSSQQKAEKPVSLYEALGMPEPGSDVTLTAEDRSQIEAAPLGSAENPVRASGPSGQKAYLARLRCPDGTQPEFKRRFSMGRGPYGTIMDDYNVTCADAEEPRIVVLDMYHKDYVEACAIAGFTIKPARKERNGGC